MSAGSGLPCQPSRSSISENPRPLTGAGQNHGGPVRVDRLGERLIDFAKIVSVDGDGAAAERLNPPGVRVQVPAQFGRAALAETVDVDDRGEVAQSVVAGLVERLPHRAFGHLAVAAQHPDAVRQLVEVPAGQGDADSVRQPLAERARGDVDPRQHRGGVALQRRAEPPVSVISSSSDTTPAALNIEYSNGDACPLEKIRWSLAGSCGPLPVVPQVPGQQHGHQVGGRHARRRMAGAGGRAGTGSSRPAAAGRAHGHHPRSARSLRSPSSRPRQGRVRGAAAGQRHAADRVQASATPMAYVGPVSSARSASSGRGSRLYRAVRHEVRARTAVATTSRLSSAATAVAVTAKAVPAPVSRLPLRPRRILSDAKRRRLGPIVNAAAPIAVRHGRMRPVGPSCNDQWRGGSR